MGNRNILKKFFSDVKSHFFAFILSLIFSLLFFYYIEDIQLSSGLIVTDIKFNNLDKNFIIKEIDNRKVRIFYKTTKENFSLINKNILKPYIDLTNVKLGKNIIKIKLEQDLLPSKTKIYKIEPKFISIVVDRRITKFLKIKSDIINKPMDGYIISSVYFTSDKVLVEGPKTILDRMDYIKTDPINVDGLDRTVLKDINFSLENIRILSPEKVSAIIEIKKQYELKEINNIPVYLLNKNINYEYILSKDTLAIKLLVPPLIKNNNIIKNISFTIDCSKITNTGTYRILPIIKLPEQYEILEIVPKEVTLTIKQKNIEKDKTYIKIPGEIKNK